MIEENVATEYTALRAANEQLREAAKQQLFAWLDTISSEVSRALAGEPLQVGRQEWQFKVGPAATMVGERYGARRHGRTLLVEVGWPREPQHGYVPDGGLARARVGLSQNIMLEPQIIAELILKKLPGANEPQWFVLADKRVGNPVSETLIRSYFQLLLAD